MPLKINLHGLELRKRSEVHAKIIDNVTGRRKRDIKESNTLQNCKDIWDTKGTRVNKSKRGFLLKDINLLKPGFKKKPMDILILGPGKGAEVIFLKEKLVRLKNNIDTLGLSNILTTKANKLKRNDFSKKGITNLNYFEHINHLSFVNKYDYIYSSLGPGVHTNHPEIVLLKVASMLRPGGFARIEVSSTSDILANLTSYLKIIGKDQNILLKVEKDFVLIERRK